MKKKKAAPKLRATAKWRSVLKSISSDCKFASPATADAIAAAQRRLQIKFPADLIGLLSESDGVQGEYSLDLVWPLARIVADNLSFRADPYFPKLYMPFDCLLFFGDAGNGDQFAYAICGGAVRTNNIFMWNHEEDSRTWVAAYLQSYLDKALTGLIEL